MRSPTPRRPRVRTRRDVGKRCYRRGETGLPHGSIRALPTVAPDASPRTSRVVWKLPGPGSPPAPQLVSACRRCEPVRSHRLSDLYEACAARCVGRRERNLRSGPRVRASSRNLQEIRVGSIERRFRRRVGQPGGQRSIASAAVVDASRIETPEARCHVEALERPVAVDDSVAVAAAGPLKMPGVGSLHRGLLEPIPVGRHAPTPSETFDVGATRLFARIGGEKLLCLPTAFTSQAVPDPPSRATSSSRLQSG